MNETRHLEDGKCIVEYNLYRLDKDNSLHNADFECIPELKGLQNKVIDANRLFAVPLKYYYNPLYKNRGKSIYDGKIDYFDMLDEIWSQASQTNRVSTPVEYYDVSILARTKDGIPILPTKYNRQYIATTGAEDGDGVTKNQGIITTQPDLNFDKYALLAGDVLNTILVGILSPSTLGLDIAKKDNAEAQREKEKQTIFTRNTIIEQETKQITDLINQALMLQDYIDSGVINEVEHEITIQYDEFANPSFESEIGILGPAWSQGQISTKQYVKLLWFNTFVSNPKRIYKTDTAEEIKRSTIKELQEQEQKKKAKDLADKKKNKNTKKLEREAQ